MKFQPTYHPIVGTPVFYWGNEQSGVLKAALQAFLNASIGKGAITPEQFDLTKAYLTYIIDAPCWKSGESGTIERLRREIREADTLERLTKWIDGCMDIGIDPI